VEGSLKWSPSAGNMNPLFVGFSGDIIPLGNPQI